MDYRSALDYVLGFSDYERQPGAGYAERWDLRRMEEFLQRLGSPHLGRRTVHVAGTKGKGSTAVMIASALNASGLKAGLYTSPHLHTMRERIRVGKQFITEGEFTEAVSEMKPAIKEQNRSRFGELSTFEILTALAFCHFRKQSADIQVLEVGLGGRLDATNVVPHPDVCVITSISLDHTAVLGNTVAQIATEKAGIIKSGATVVSSRQTPEASEVIRSVCRAKGARLIMVGQEVTWVGIQDSGDSRGIETVLSRTQSFEVKGLKRNYRITIPLLGEHQMENAATAVATLEALDIDEGLIREGLANVSWPGRIQVLGEEPLLIVDGAHNADSVRRLREAIQKHFRFDRAILIMGTSADKNSAAMIGELASYFDRVITTASEHPRAADPDELATEFARKGIRAQATRNVRGALEAALAQADKSDLICATGSLFLVAEVIEQIKGTKGERYPYGERVSGNR
ncbi:MAG: bifunctional folylpolyglutamate synthase/dihydrofolate synthase [Dehalococcoidia bacterium]|nr:bifunctional folylpolyglutamate synthase/dihydrofolate synthase [Dehalococcoidia bacterium]